jgi:diguanylate cyclase (GGDEF)-like protein
MKAVDKADHPEVHSREMHRQTKTNVPRRILWLTLATSGAALGSIVVMLLWIGRQLDATAYDDSRERVSTAIHLMIERVAFQTSDYAHWDSAYFWYRDGAETELYDNLGTGASTSEVFDFITLLGPDGTVTHGFANDVTASDTGLADPVVTGQLFGLGQALPVDSYDVASGLAQSGGGVVIVAITRLRPVDLTGLGAADIPYMIGGFRLDPAGLGQLVMKEDLTFKPPGQAVLPGRSAIPLYGIDGEELGVLTWPTERPGRALLRDMAPVVGLLSVLFGIGGVGVAQIAARQTAAYLQERSNARTDPVTGLLNRTGLSELADDPVLQDNIERGRVAAIYVDLDGLKGLNDRYGHAAGDRAIQIIAERLLNCVRVQDNVARIGGDEFVCIVIDDDPETATTQIAERFRALSAVAYSEAGMRLTAQASIGIALSASGVSWSELLDQADKAMYAAKKARTGTSPPYPDSALRAS